MNRNAAFFIDDVIWTFRDLARLRPQSLFDNPFMKMLKTAHDLYGMKVQLNVFLRTDFYYGNDEFNLREMPDCYKSEFEEASDWLKLAFHAKQEFPDYPYVNASYEDAKANYDEFKNAACHFAGEKSIAVTPIIHWGAMSLDGCKALYNSGVRLLSASPGKRTEYNGDPTTLPYGHAGRLLQNRKPEAMVFERDTRDKSIKASICSHNFINEEQFAETKYTLNAIKDEATGLYFKKLNVGLVLNLTPLNELEEEFLLKGIGREYCGYSTHEQYFYPEYYAYQPEYKEKLMIACEELYKNDYTFIFMQDLIK